MNCISKQAAARGIKTLTLKKNLELYERLMLGDRSARNEMIEGNMPLVVSRMNALLSSSPCAERYRDDLMAEGFLALVTAVDRLATHDRTTDPRPLGYLKKAIDRALKAFADSQLSPLVPARVLRQAQASGDTTVAPALESLDIVQHDVAGDDPYCRYEMLELTMSCCKTPEERTIVNLRSEGATDRETSHRTGIPLATVARLRMDVYQRMQAKLEASR
jgi:DNA-directed RNA polymerase specialized sigma subunit